MGGDKLWWPVVVLALASCSATQASKTEIPIPQITAIPTATVLLTQAPLPTFTPSPIPHLMKPSVGTQNEAIAHDINESLNYRQRNVADGDNFRMNLFERPFNAANMKYLPFIDIKDFIMTSDTNWYFSQIILSGTDDQRFIHGTYGAEFDLNVDGRAELLVFVENPWLDWTTDRVRVYLDGNGDIGGNQSSPDVPYSGNGFDVLLFDSGLGSDPDSAWAKFENGDHPKVDLAIKRSLFHEYTAFMWSVFASESAVDPEKFYFNDTTAESLAGSPNKSSKYYPVKALSALDNTCRIPIGFQRNGREPLGCVAGEGKTITWMPHDMDWCKTFVCPRE